MKRWSMSDRDGTADSRESGSDRPSVEMTSGNRNRAQTTLDFTTGVVLFVFVLVAIFAFVAGTIQPFTAGDQEDIVAVNRVADGLAKDTLGDPDTPYILDADCTVAFFEGGSPPPDCRFGSPPLREQVGVTDSAFLNVTLRGNVSGSSSPNELLCWDETAGKLVEQGTTDCTGTDVETLAVGDDAASGAQSSVTARRSVSINGTSVSLVVKLW
ncbi:hypothetical protein SAMN05216388_1006131 [Halorientalis persicus]|jgi:hypothetical protein|uniref:Uncharacterized protein n=1 Tax=Halorientalis persicus TaxID=1367881 RepID=A0A1H8KP70_9EURY|nr:hypothetical protein [Halorientalis persicus]SEN94743.1 hypothetical protein SAMN05216388_1006131 [Halorientalis persicus]